jgi:hypothetical protein
MVQTTARSTLSAGDAVVTDTRTEVAGFELVRQRPFEAAQRG